MRISAEQMTAMSASYTLSVMELSIRVIAPGLSAEEQRICLDSAATTLEGALSSNEISDGEVARLTYGFVKEWVELNAPRVVVAFPRPP